MKEKFSAYKSKLSESWASFSPVTKWSVIGSFLITLLILIVFVFLSNRSDFSVLYSNLTAAEAGEIKAAIEAQTIPVEVSADGTTISVPKEHLANLKVSLAAEGIPKNGNVNYGIFSENMGLGMTDRHFDVVERDAMQNELAYLIQQIDGVTEANVMITLPKENVWITDEEQTSTASIVVKGDPTFQLDQKQVNGLYHLISKSVPSLPPEQIVIMDQNGQVFEVKDASQADTNLTAYQQHREIQKGIEQDIQRELQQMLGLLLGQDKVVVSVMTNIDFTKEKREEQLVEPVDIENNEGLDISVERIVETFSSEGTVAEDAAGTGDTEVANYPAGDAAGNSESERTEERINSEVNRINRQIEMSPYVIDDITINVGVEPPVPENPASLSQENITDISNLLKNAVSTSLSMNEFPVTEAELEDKISVFATEFQGRPAVEEEEPETTFLSGIPNNLLLVIGAAVVLLIIIIIAVILLRRKKKEELFEEDYDFGGFEQALAKSNQVNLEAEEEEMDLSEFSAKANPKRKTIEKLAKGRPEDFAKLLRSWMADD
ncbi:flagellar basal-body MS-ring/collar protein FliF [Microbacterium sp. APC 3898]|uniref:Flagellar M-ring protein n=1 Tax=Planococcus notacanthi TaxID=3035188 RepID=A0ABT7ZL57_9BACL|nr:MULTISPECIES: flagellar basal-body MS-ring/collar protein FliF [Terrabacteria group]MDN3427894.1 flagellar basal-body MS-ring/collar protein FliF [Planococcus sp. APC 4016]MDN3498571.1 flagellar basal-body MS-ring/collar protein FliF [Microbacterium sp. APC 3898]